MARSCKVASAMCKVCKELVLIAHMNRHTVLRGVARFGRRKAQRADVGVGSLAWFRSRRVLMQQAITYSEVFSFVCCSSKLYLLAAGVEFCIFHLSDLWSEGFQQDWVWSKRNNSKNEVQCYGLLGLLQPAHS